MRFNPGPFEPVVYLLQKPAMFRAIGLGGLLLFTMLAFSIAGSHGGAGALMLGLVLLGALANEHRDGRWLFGVGAVVASTVWFTTLGFGARRLRRLFATPAAWRILDGLIAVTMICLGVLLVT